jgi:small GTP-binding protein
MLKHKVCMLGAFAVGKTSLVRRFTTEAFSEKYLTTVGVTIEKKPVAVDGDEVSLLIWDIQGEDQISKVPMSYLRGASGYLLVVDGTRGQTLETAISLHDRARAELGDVPFVILLNKCDLRHEWQLEESAVSRLRSRGWRVIPTSARTGLGANEAFQTLATDIVKGRAHAAV